jgi:hypothetical protein
MNWKILKEMATTEARCNPSIYLWGLRIRILGAVVIFTEVQIWSLPL